MWSIFVTVGKHGTEEGLNVSALCRVITLVLHDEALREFRAKEEGKEYLYRFDMVHEFIKTMRGIDSGWRIMKRNLLGEARLIKSLPDFVSFVMDDALIRIGTPRPKEVPTMEDGHE